MREKELVCIGCPLGCSLKVTIQDDSTMEVTGNTCPRGADYARKELTDPRRIVILCWHGLKTPPSAS